MATYRNVAEASGAYSAAKSLAGALSSATSGIKNNISSGSSGAKKTSSGSSSSSSRSSGNSLAGAISSAVGNVGNAIKNNASSGGGSGKTGSTETVKQTANGLGYYGDDPALNHYYNNLADLYNNDKAEYNKTVYDRSSDSKSMMPNMSRDPSLAGKVVAKGNYAVYYDENGYATKAIKMGQGTSTQDLNNNGYYTGAQRTMADITGNGLPETGTGGGTGISVMSASSAEGRSLADAIGGAMGGIAGSVGDVLGGASDSIRDHISSGGSSSNSGNSSGNTTATLPNGQTIHVSYTNGKITSSLPVGSIVHTAGGDYIITGGSPGNYTSNPYTGQSANQGTAVDYSVLLNNAINSGASWQEVQAILQQRNDKISADPSLSKYLYDENYVRAMQYIYSKQQAEAQLEANLASLKGAYDQSVLEYEAARDRISPTYQAQRNSTAATSDVNWNAFNEVAAANGLNTGAVGQAALSRAVALQNDLNELNRSEAEEISQIDLEMAQLAAEYNSAIAQAQMSGDADLAARLYEQFNQYIASKQTQRQEALAAQQAQAEAQAAQRETAYDRAMEILSYGVMPSSELLAAAGIDEATARAIYARVVAELGGTGGSTGGSGGSGSRTSSGGSRSGSGSSGGQTSSNSVFNINTADQSDYGNKTTDTYIEVPRYKADGTRGGSVMLEWDNFLQHYNDGDLTIQKGSDGKWYVSYHEGTLKDSW